MLKDDQHEGIRATGGRKKVEAHPSRVSIGGCDDERVLVRGLSVQGLPQKKQADPEEAGWEIIIHSDGNKTQRPVNI